MTSPDREDARARAEMAAAWVEKLTRGDAGDRDIDRLRAWVREDPRNRAAYEQARAIWAALPETQLARPWWRSRKVQGLAVAASLAVAVLLSVPHHDISTGTNQLRHIRLADGTEGWIDALSAIDIRYDGDRRRIVLAEGRAAFKVARDNRPFEVSAAGASIRDIGTEFSVDAARRLTVAVWSGEVEVRPAKGAPVRLIAGQSVSLGGTGEQIGAGDGAFGWREHRLVFDRMPLADALAELDRYYPGRLVLTDKALSTRLVSGTVFTSDPGAALETIARSQHLSLTRLPFVTFISAAPKKFAGTG